MPTKIQLKRTNELTDEKRKSLVVAEPLVDLDNNKVIIGKSGSDDIGFALGDHAIAFTHTGEATTSPKLKLTTPNSSTELTIEGNNGIQVSDNSGALKIENTYDGHMQSSSTIDKLVSYAKADSASAIATSDSLNTALGKLEYKADSHKHSTAYTPAGSVSAKFTGTSNQTTSAEGSATINSSGKTTVNTSDDATVNFSKIEATYTPTGTITGEANKASTAASTSKITGCLVTRNGTAATCTFPTLNGTAPSISASIDKRKMSISISNGSYSLSGGSFVANTLPTLTPSTDISTADHTHTVTVSHGAHTFNGTQTTIESTATQTAHKHSIPELAVSVSGNVTDHTHTYTADGTVSATFAGTAATLTSNEASY